MSRPFSVEACDFSGWATRNDLKCSDGRVIRRDAFKNNDGIKVPLVWNHQHNSPRDVLGHAWLENREEGVYTYGFLNDTADGEIAKVLIKHGDICALSIYANQLQQAGSDVLHGCICEVSLVHKGANPGAFIDSMLKHGEMSDDEAIIYTGMPLCLSHSAESKDEPKEEEKKKDTKEDKPAEDKEEKKDNEETIADVIDSMSEKQQNVMYALIAQALEGEPEKESKDDSDNKSESNKEDKTMKHNVFDNDQQKKTEVLSHADQASIISMAKSNSVGSLRTAMDIYAEQNPDSVLAHGIDGIETLFPEYKDVRPGAPELLTTDQGWVNEVLKKVHKSPISRIRNQVLYRVQTGAFSNKANADAMLQKVKAAGFDTYMVKVDNLYKIQVGAFSKKANADAMAAKLKAAGFDTYITTKSGTAVSASSAKKSTDQIAREVIQGLWGNGADRTNRLKAAGYDPSVIQNRVNQLLK